jgi:hypothetical protein
VRQIAASRKTHFQWMTDEEVAHFETIIERAFRFDIDPDDITRLPNNAQRAS